MKNRSCSLSKISFIFVSLVFFPLFSSANPLVLFDSGHAQTAGNADWVINGGFSDFADVFISEGCKVSSVNVLTPGNINDASILVLPEPNSVYSPEEEAAIVSFVNNGGGLYAIGDHNGSDRNKDGIDSVGVLNKFLPKLGLELNKRSFSEAPVSGSFSQSPLLLGVKAVGTWGGTSVKCLAASAIAHVCVSQKNGGDAYIATNIVGTKGGKVIAMGDSSPYDDGTGNPGDHLYNGFSNPGYQHDFLAKNSVKWLLAKDISSKPERLTVVISDLKSAYNVMNQAPSEGVFQFIENCEKTVLETLNSNPDLKAGFFNEVSGDPSFDWMRGIELTKEIFSDIYQ